MILHVLLLMAQEVRRMAWEALRNERGSFLPIIGALAGIWSSVKGAEAAEAARKAASETAQGLTPEELADLEKTGRSNIAADLAARGVMDSGIQAGGEALLKERLGLAQAAAKRGGAAAALPYLQRQAEQPNLVTQLVPLLQRLGFKIPGMPDTGTTGAGWRGVTYGTSKGWPGGYIQDPWG